MKRHRKPLSRFLEVGHDVTQAAKTKRKKQNDGEIEGKEKTTTATTTEESCYITKRKEKCYKLRNIKLKWAWTTIPSSP